MTSNENTPPALPVAPDHEAARVLAVKRTTGGLRITTRKDDEALDNLARAYLALASRDAERGFVHDPECELESGAPVCECPRIRALPPKASEPTRHEWDKSGERCLRCGAKDWMGGPCSAAPQASEPEAVAWVPTTRFGDQWFAWTDGDKEGAEQRIPRINEIHPDLAPWTLTPLYAHPPADAPRVMCGRCLKVVGTYPLADGDGVHTCNPRNPQYIEAAPVAPGPSEELMALSERLALYAHGPAGDSPCECGLCEVIEAAWGALRHCARSHPSVSGTPERGEGVTITEAMVEAKAVELANWSNGDPGAISAEQWWVVLSDADREDARQRARAALSGSPARGEGVDQ